MQIYSKYLDITSTQFIWFPFSLPLCIFPLAPDISFQQKLKTIAALVEPYMKLMPITFYFTTFVGHHHIHEYNQGNHSQERMKRKHNNQKVGEATLSKGWWLNLQ